VTSQITIKKENTNESHPDIQAQKIVFGLLGVFLYILKAFR